MPSFLLSNDVLSEFSDDTFLRKQFLAGRVGSDSHVWSINANKWIPIAIHLANPPPLPSERSTPATARICAPNILIQCSSCEKHLRLRLRVQAHRLKCPHCKAALFSIRLEANKLYLTIEPSMSDEINGNGSLSASEARRLLDIDDSATTADIKRAYRAKVKQYHPDMTAHLGQELRDLATRITKRLNRAYELLAK